jgi:recombination protein RecT
MSTQLAALNKTPNVLITVRDLLQKHKQQFADALPKYLDPERFARVGVRAIAENSLLLKCDANSLVGALMEAAILGVEPNSVLGEAYLIPYWNNKANRGKGGYEAQLQVGYQGLIKLCRNSGQVRDIEAQPVHEFDVFDYQRGSNTYLHHKPPIKGPCGRVIGYYASFRTADSFHFEYRTIEEIEEHRDRFSQGAYKKERGSYVLDDAGKRILQGPWKDNPDWMCRKTVLIQVLKLAPKSVALMTAVNLDERADAGVPQQFSPEIPCDFQPALDTTGADEAMPPEEPMPGEHRPPAEQK